ncbi:cytochrome P450, partial [Phascolomyces articulosus]
MISNTIIPLVEPYLQSSTLLRPLLLKLGLSGTALWIITKYFIYRLYLHPVNSIPGPSVDWIPLLGNMREIVKDDPGAPHRRWTKRYGSVVGYKGPWNNPRILVTDPNLLKEILTLNQYDYIKPAETKQFLGPVVGEGVLLVEGDIHKYQRKMLNPAFSVQALRGLVPAIAVPAIHLRDKWLKMLSAGKPTEIKISSDLNLATLDVIGVAGFGANFGTVQGADPDTSGGRLSQAYMDLFTGEASLQRILALFIPLFRQVPTQRNKALRRDIETLHKEAMAIVERGKSEFGSQHEKGKKSRNLLDLMIGEVDEETGQGMSSEDLQAQCLTFLAAGHETTAVSLSWGLWLLAQNPEVQEELREEVNTIFSNNVDELPSYDAINNLTVLNNVCKETMRLYPPVPMTNRVSVKDGVLGGQYFVPKGTRIFISPMVTHTNPEYWGDDADKFRPSRWNESPANQVNPYVYMPFLEGGRKCIGYRFALIEFKIIMALLVMRLKFSEKPGFSPRMKQQVTLRPAPNMTLMVE